MTSVVFKAKFVDVVPPSPEWQLIHRQADAMIPVLRATFMRAVRAVGLATPWDEIEELLASGFLDVGRLVPWNAVGSDALMDPLTRIFQMVFARSGRLSARQLQPRLIDGSFRIRKQLEAVFVEGHPRASTWAQRNAAERVVEIEAGTALAIRAYIVEGFDLGIAPRALAREMRRAQIVGLTERHALAVVRRHARLIARGLSPERIARETERYAARLLRLRTENIARTETLRAATEGQLEAWTQSREAGTLSRSVEKRWIVTRDLRLCPICAPLTGIQVAVDQLFTTSIGRVPGPPAHPSCRCALGLANPRPVS